MVAIGDMRYKPIIKRDVWMKYILPVLPHSSTGNRLQMHSFKFDAWGISSPLCGTCRAMFPAGSGTHNHTYGLQATGFELVCEGGF